jgi:predicted RNA-binding protein with PIN domain
MAQPPAVTSPPNTLLRPALEAALQVARAGESADPTEPAPSALRRYLNFARLPAPALEIARRVIEEDAAFRQRVATKMTEQDVGEAGWLWLTRPDGWEERVEELRKQQQQLEHAVLEEKQERGSQRRLAGAEERARRAEVALTAKARDIEEARAALAEERALRRRAESDLAKIATAVDELQSDRNAAVRKLKDVEAELAQRAADLRHARHEIRMREAELEQAIAARTTAQTALAAAQQSALVPGQSSSPGSPTAAGSQAANEAAANTELAALVAEAAAGAERLSASLAAAAQLLVPAEQPRAVAPGQEQPAAAPSGRRQPVRLRPGTADDTPEAADQLLHVPGAVLLVDGYNVSQSIWWEQPIALQRDRLVSALEELHARCGVDVEVVFDGAEVERTPGATPRSAIRVRFSPPGVEADDVILERIGSIPSRRPVVVASSDGRVRDGARHNGANVLTARQLAEALRR